MSDAPSSSASEAVIEHDPHDHSREYIPLPGGWEVQTKGAGSTYRLLDKKTGERHGILSGKDWQGLQAFFTRFAHELFEACRPSPEIERLRAENERLDAERGAYFDEAVSERSRRIAAEARAASAEAERDEAHEAVAFADENRTFQIERAEKAEANAKNLRTSKESKDA